MSKNKKGSKELVRNPSVPFRSGKTTEKGQNLKKVHFSDDVISEGGNPAFIAPQFCTLLQLRDEMKAIRNTQCTARSLPDMSGQKNLNFLPEEKIYQDLVELDVPTENCITEVRSQPCFKLKKDPEVDVSKYTKYDLEPEYFFTSYAVPLVKTQKAGFNGLSIYNKMATWKDFTD